MPETPTKHKLSDAEKALLAEIHRDIENLQQQMQGVLRLALRTRGLGGRPGQWNLQGDELVEAK